MRLGGVGERDRISEIAHQVACKIDEAFANALFA